MIGTTIRRKGARGARFTITAASGPTWVATPEDFGPPLSLTVADLTSGAYVVEDGATITGPDQRPSDVIERDAWARVGRAVDEPAADEQPASPLTAMTEADAAFEELRAGRHGRGVFKARAEHYFVINAPPSTEGYTDDLRAEAASRVAADLIRLHGREAIQAGAVPGINARVLAAVRDHLKTAEEADR